jgi:outer membrane protein OmpA-like peptidoglycan-associated protein
MFKTTKDALTTQKEKSKKVFTKNFSMVSIKSNNPLRIKNIYFAFGSWLLKKESTTVLDTLGKKLLDQPNIDIELSAHTDCRGSSKYNKWLSEKRAQAAVGYLAKMGISKTRMLAKGYGESMPVNKCRDGVKCTDEEYDKNRRIEFRMIKLRTDEQKAVDAAKGAAKKNAGKVIVTSPKL